MDFGTLALVQAVVWVVVGAAFLAIPRQWVALTVAWIVVALSR
jgi:hypothetical protein